MKVYGALENAQTEWFTNAGKPAAASFPYRKIFVTDLQQEQISDGTQWIVIPSNVAANAFTGTNSFAGATTHSGSVTNTGSTSINAALNLGLTTDATNYGAISSYSNSTPMIEFTGTVTALSGFSTIVAGGVIMLVNRTGGIISVKDEDTGTTSTQRIRTGTGSSISLSNNASLLFAYAGDGRWHVIGGSGSGSAGGAKNYFALSLANPDFETNAVTPWQICSTTFANNAPGALSLGTGSMSLSINSTAPLSGTYDLLLTKPSSNCAGNGFISGVLTLDREDYASGSMMYGQFSYKSANTNLDVSGTSTESLEVWVYDVTASVWIAVSNFRGINRNTLPGKLQFAFQPTITSSQYRVAVFTQQTSTLAYALEMDNFQLGPVAPTIASNITTTPWTAYTPTYSNFGSATGSIFWRQVGDSLELSGSFVTGTVAGGLASISLPNGYKIDTSKVPSGTSVQGRGERNITTTGAQGYYFTMLVDPANPTNIYFSSGNNGLITGNPANANSLFGSAETAFITVFRVPVVGFLTSGYTGDGSVVSFTGTIASQTVTSNITDIAATAVLDRLGGWNGTQYQVKSAGDYGMTVNFSENAAITPAVYVNGTALVGGSFGSSATTGYSASGFVVIPNAKVGDLISVRSNTTGTVASGGNIGIFKISGGVTFGPASSLVATYALASTQTVSAGGTIPFLTKIIDTHNAVSASQFKAPFSANFRISMKAYYSTGGSNTNIYCYKNGANFATIGYLDATVCSVNSSFTIPLLANDLIDFRTLSLYGFNGGTAPMWTYFSIEQVQ